MKDDDEKKKNQKASNQDLQENRNLEEEIRKILKSGFIKLKTSKTPDGVYISITPTTGQMKSSSDFLNGMQMFDLLNTYGFRQLVETQNNRVDFSVKSAQEPKDIQN